MGSLSPEGGDRVAPVESNCSDSHVQEIRFVGVQRKLTEMSEKRNENRPTVQQDSTIARYLDKAVGRAERRDGVGTSEQDLNRIGIAHCTVFGKRRQCGGGTVFIACR